MYQRLYLLLVFKLAQQMAGTFVNIKHLIRRVFIYRNMVVRTCCSDYTMNHLNTSQVDALDLTRGGRRERKRKAFTHRMCLFFLFSFCVCASIQVYIKTQSIIIIMIFTMLCYYVINIHNHNINSNIMLQKGVQFFGSCSVFPNFCTATERII